MNYIEYKTEYNRLILLQSLKNRIQTKSMLAEIITTIDKEGLENILRTNDLDFKIDQNKDINQMYKYDSEISNLLEKDEQVTQKLRQIIEDRIKELYMSQSIIKEAPSNENYIETSKEEEPKTNGKEYIETLKFIMKGNIARLSKINSNLGQMPPEELLQRKTMMREFLNSYENYAMNAVQPEDDEELKQLFADEISAIQQLRDTAESLIEQYQEKSRVETSEKKGDNQDYNQISRKSWELSQTQKDKIQNDQQKVAETYTKNETNNSREPQNTEEDLEQE